MAWEDYERSAERGPVGFGIKIGLAIILIASVLGVVGWGLGWFSEAAQVTKEQYGPRAAVMKYEWFKDAHATLAARKASIETLEKAMKDTDEAYKGVARKDWPRDERESYSQRKTEIAGLKMSYNNLAAEYNANMAKINFKYANVGDTPDGSSLPKNVATYVTQ